MIPTFDDPALSRNAGSATRHSLGGAVPDRVCSEDVHNVCGQVSYRLQPERVVCRPAEVPPHLRGQEVAEGDPDQGSARDCAPAGESPSPRVPTTQDGGRTWCERDDAEPGHGVAERLGEGADSMRLRCKQAEAIREVRRRHRDDGDLVGRAIRHGRPHRPRAASDCHRLHRERHRRIAEARVRRLDPVERKRPRASRGRRDQRSRRERDHRDLHRSTVTHPITSAETNASIPPPLEECNLPTTRHVGRRSSVSLFRQRATARRSVLLPPAEMNVERRMAAC
jgi:hypothetical protein